MHDRIDIDHPASVAYLERHGAEPPPLPPPKAPTPASRPTRARPNPVDSSAPQSESSPEPGPDLDDPVDAILSLGLTGDDGAPLTRIEAGYFAGMTLERIAREYGTMAVFADVLDAVKTIAIIREKDDKHRREEGEVITRELVTHAFGELDKLSRHLLKPVPDAIVGRALDMSSGGKTVEDVRKVAREIMSSELDAVWSAIAALLRKA